MKKIDKLVFGSFIGPFLLTLVVVPLVYFMMEGGKVEGGKVEA